MSNLSDIEHLGDAFDTCTTTPGGDAPAAGHTYPWVGLALVVSSAALSCGAAYFVLAG
ncbi:hypothetical protein [Massilia sp. GCM10023247]|uniref:hypothetical protein n=1 Tax=Massilia sp. GCM10023247 TaxID=3252643 RepID=UPI003623A363